MLNSYIEMDAIDGKKIYRIFPVNNRQEFEESEVYHDLFRKNKILYSMGVSFTGSPSTVTCLVSSLIASPPTWYRHMTASRRWKF